MKGWKLLRTISGNEIDNYPDYKRLVEMNEVKLVQRPTEYLVDVYIPEKAKLKKWGRLPSYKTRITEPK